MQYLFISINSYIADPLRSNYQYGRNKFPYQVQVDVVYTDCAKAFDRIDHSIYPNEMSDFGFSDPLRSPLTSDLVNHARYVAYNGFSQTTSGVSRGSHLGLYYFWYLKLLFANDLNIYTIPKRGMTSRYC